MFVYQKQENSVEFPERLKAFVSSLLSQTPYCKRLQRRGKSEQSDYDRLIQEYRRQAFKLACKVATLTKTFKAYEANLKADLRGSDEAAFRFSKTALMVAISPVITKGIFWLFGLNQSIFVPVLLLVIGGLVVLHVIGEIEERNCSLDENRKNLNNRIIDQLNRNQLKPASRNNLGSTLHDPYRMLEQTLPALTGESHFPILIEARSVLRQKLKDPKNRSSEGDQPTEADVLKHLVAVAEQICSLEQTANDINSHIQEQQKNEQILNGLHKCLLTLFNNLYREMNDRLEMAQAELEYLSRQQAEIELAPDHFSRDSNTQIDWKIRLIRLRISALEEELRPLDSTYLDAEAASKNTAIDLLLERCLEKIGENPTLSLKQALTTYLEESLFLWLLADLSGLTTDKMIKKFISNFVKKILPLLQERLAYHQNLTNHFLAEPNPEAKGEEAELHIHLKS